MKHKFDEINQPKDRKPRGKGKRTLMLDAIKSVCGSEKEFLEAVVRQAMGDEETKPNPTLMTMVIQRIEPPIKSVMPFVEFDFNPKSSPADQASQVMKAAAEGKVSPDVANMFVSSIASMLKIEEITELQKRIEQIESQLGLG